ncbi:MAG: hypothetical protein V3V08_04860 [Nannocystaceae bacterium]
MSFAEIADNKWESESAKPPVKNIAAMASMLMMGVFALLFAALLIGAIVGTLSPKTGNSLEKRFQDMDSVPAAAKP